MKERALKIVNDLYTQHIPVDEIAFTIRSLIEELDKQEYRNKHEGFSTIIDKVKPQTKPLTDEEIKELSELTSDPDPTSFVRAIEERHGIK